MIIDDTSAADRPRPASGSSPGDAATSDPAPVRPQEPDAADCCGEGCVRCIFDVYDEAMERYGIAMAAWQARQK